jgi:hypothetical protein
VQPKPDHQQEPPDPRQEARQALAVLRPGLSPGQRAALADLLLERKLPWYLHPPGR